MSDDRVRPIRPDIKPEFNAEHELVDWCRSYIRDNLAANEGRTPRTIALVILGGVFRDEDGTLSSHTTTTSWSPDDSALRSEGCALAAALLMKRATGG